MLKVMDLIIVSVQSEKEMKQFIEFPNQIYVDDPFWPGLDYEVEELVHDRSKNFIFSYIDSQLFLAVSDGKVVGRISATVNEVHNNRWNENVGFFGHFECINDQEVANKLLSTVEQWVKDRGKDQILGPFNYTYYGILGILVQGFDDRPTVDVAYNPQYYRDLIENAGFTKQKDLYEIIGSTEQLISYSQKKYASVQHLIDSGQLSVRRFDEDRKEEELLTVFDLYNDSFLMWPFQTMTGEEWLFLFNNFLYQYLPNELFLVVEEAGIPVGFFFGQVDCNEILYNKRHGKNSDITRLKAFVMGIKKGYQEMGISKILFYEIGKQLEGGDYKEISYSWIDEINTRSLNMNMAMGGPVDKVFRIYSKTL